MGLDYTLVQVQPALSLVGSRFLGPESGIVVWKVFKGIAQQQIGRLHSCLNTLKYLGKINEKKDKQPFVNTSHQLFNV